MSAETAPAAPISPPLTRRATATPASDSFHRWLHDALRDVHGDSAILALGCDEAFLAPHLLEYASDITVLDTSGGQLAQLARRFPEISFLAHHPARPLPFPARAFDVACCCEFLDRVFDPLTALREIHRVLAPGGRLLVAVPDHGAVRNMLSVLLRREDERAAANPRLHHFNRRSLAKILREAGFTDLRLASASGASQDRRDLRSRRLLVTAQKGPEMQRVAPAPQVRDQRFDGIFEAEELAFAGRVRAA